MTGQGSDNRLRGLDGLRAIAAIAVVCMHVWLYGEANDGRATRSGFLDYVAFELRLGLLLFFVLSGYLLYGAFARAALGQAGPVELARYARRRVARIVPAYYLSLVGAVALLWGSANATSVNLPAWNDLPLFLAFAQNYSADTAMRLNPVTWTLAIEAAFYVALPLIGVAAYRMRRGGFAAQSLLLGGLALVGIAWSALVYYGEGGWLAAKALPAYLPYFAFGMFVALVTSRPRARRLGAAVSAGVFAGGLLLVALNAYWHAVADEPARDALLSIFRDLPAGIGFAAVVYAVVAGCGGVARWTGARPMAWPGTVSYGIYLWHVPLLLFMRRLDLMPSGFVPTLLLVLPPVLLVAAASWYLVERPLLAAAARPRAPRPRAAEDLRPAHAAP